jgi:hypothetical protein
VLVGVGKLAQFCFTSPIMVERNKAAITPTTLAPAPEDYVKSVSDKLADLEEIGASPTSNANLPLLE